MAAELNCCSSSVCQANPAKCIAPSLKTNILEAALDRGINLEMTHKRGTKLFHLVQKWANFLLDVLHKPTTFNDGSVLITNKSSWSLVYISKQQGGEDQYIEVCSVPCCFKPAVLVTIHHSRCDDKEHVNSMNAILISQIIISEAQQIYGTDKQNALSRWSNFLKNVSDKGEPGLPVEVCNRQLIAKREATGVYSIRLVGGNSSDTRYFCTRFGCTTLRSKPVEVCDGCGEEQETSIPGNDEDRMELGNGQSLNV